MDTPICKWKDSNNIIVALNCKNTKHCDYSTRSLNTIIKCLLVDLVQMWLGLKFDCYSSLGCYSSLSIDFSSGMPLGPCPIMQLSPVDILLIIIMHSYSHWKWFNVIMAIICWITDIIKLMGLQLITIKE